MFVRLMLSSVLFAAAALLAYGCSGEDTEITRANGPEGTIPLHYDGGTLWVEIPMQQEDFRRGLSNRESMPPYVGMLFVYNSPRTPAFVMRDMHFPLDFIWIDEDKKIAEITPDAPTEPGVPGTELVRYMPEVPIQYVLEVNAGTAERLGLEVGDQLEFEVPPTGIFASTPETDPTPATD